MVSKKSTIKHNKMKNFQGNIVDLKKVRKQAREVHDIKSQ